MSHFSGISWKVPSGNVLLMVMGIQFLSLGLLGEMMTQQAAQEKEEGHFYEVLESPRTYEIEAEYPVGTASGS